MHLHAGREAAVAKQTEMTPATYALPAALLEATSRLSENLAQSEPSLRSRAAEARLNADAEAQQLLKDLSELQQSVRSRQYAPQGAGAVSEKDLKRLRELQTAVGNNEVIQDYGMTQQLAASFLREVNQAISQLLGIDFASLARRSGG